MTRIKAELARTFRSLRLRNYRLYFFGQVVSVSGTWMQSVAQGWLVLRITESPANHRTGSLVDLGVATSLQFLPLLVLGAYGGLLADRLPKRRTLVLTQAASGSLALALGALTVSRSVRLWEVYLLAAGLGLVTMVDNPTRQSFVQEMVGPELLPNAVSLNSVVMNGARVVGPAVAGVLIDTVGLAACFFVNAASYLAVIVGLCLMRQGELRPSGQLSRQRGQLRAGMAYVWSQRDLREPLLMMVVIGTLAYNFQVTLPALAKASFHGGAGTYATMLAVMSLGAVAGGLAVASRGRPGRRTLRRAAAAFGTLILAVSVAPSLPVALAVLPLMGSASIVFIAMANTTLQLRADPSMRGRVMALYAIAFLGTTPIGSPLIGAVGELAGPRVAIAIGGLAALGAAAFLGGWRRDRRLGGRRAAPQRAAVELAGADLAGQGAGVATSGA